MNNKNKMRPKVTIYKNKQSAYSIVFSEQALNVIKTDKLFFDKRLLKFRLPNFDDNKICELKNVTIKDKYKNKIYEYKSKLKRFSIGLSGFNEEIQGKYFLEEENEWFVLIKQ